MNQYLRILGVVVTALFLSTNAVAKKGGKEKAKTVDCAVNSLQEAVDMVKPPATIFVSGVCNEDVTVSQQDITLSGNGSSVQCNKNNPAASAGATVNGVVRIDSVRASVEFLEITGAGNGIEVADGASADLNCNAISANDRSGVVVSNGSSATLRDNTVDGNGVLGVGSGNPFNFVDCGVSLAGASAVYSAGNTYQGNDYAAVCVSGRSHFRNGSFLPRNGGYQPVSSERDVIIERGCAPQSSGCFTDDEGPLAINVFDGSSVSLRNAEVHGEVVSEVQSAFRAHDHVDIRGNIEAKLDGMVRIRDRNISGRDVSFEGTLVCSDTSREFYSSVQCGQTCSGAVPDTCSSPELVIPAFSVSCSDPLKTDEYYIDDQTSPPELVAGSHPDSFSIVSGVIPPGDEMTLQLIGNEDNFQKIYQNCTSTPKPDFSAIPDPDGLKAMVLRGTSGVRWRARYVLTREANSLSTTDIVITRN